MTLHTNGMLAARRRGPVRRRACSRCEIAAPLGWMYVAIATLAMAENNIKTNSIGLQL